MKLQVLVLFAFTACVLGGVISDVESRDDLSIADKFDLVSRDDLDAREPHLSTRESLSIDVEARDSEAHVAVKINARQPPFPYEFCPHRSEAVKWFRRGTFPFVTHSRYIGFLFPTSKFNTFILFFLWGPRTGDYFYTTSRAERNYYISRLGYRNRGSAGYIFFNQRCGGSPLYRMFNAERGQHFYTVSNLERARARRAGWSDEGTIGYIFPD